MSIKTKIFTALLPIIILPLFILGWVSFFKLRDAVQESVITERANLLDQLTDQVRVAIRTTGANIQLFSNSKLIQKYVLIPDEWERYALLQPALIRLLRSYQTAYPEYFEIRILLPDGYEDTRATVGIIPNTTEEEKDSPYFQSLSTSEQEIFTTFFQNPDTKKPAFLVARKLLLVDHAVDEKIALPSLRGYLAITVELDFVGNILKDLHSKTKGYIFFVNRSRVIIAANHRAMIGHDLPQPLITRLSTSDSPGPVMDQFLGTTSLLQYRQVHPDLFLVSALQENELLAESLALGKVVLALTIVAVLLTVVLLLSGLRFLILRPISLLSDAAREIGEGNLEVKIPINSRDEVGELAQTFEEMAARLQASKEKIAHLAMNDALTGLPNRSMFKDYFSHVIARAVRLGERLALVFLDLDDFKNINDTLGHHGGDELLKTVSERLQQCVRGTDIVGRSQQDTDETMIARLGGDEFLLLISGVNTQSDVEKICDRVLEELSKPAEVQGHEIFLSTSMGIVLFPDDGRDVDTLLKNADMAMYEAKKKGKNRYAYFAKSMQENVLQRLKISNKLRRALDEGELQLYFQPILDARTLKIKAFEALTRWQDSEIGWISPDIFIPIAEETGLIIPQTEWLLKEAFSFWKKLQEKGLEDVPISVNFSNVLTKSDDALVRIEKTLKNMDFNPRDFEVELTETYILKDMEKAFASLNQIKGWGVKISIDDFGTGYSSLSYLSSLPVDSLKIDKSFVSDLALGDRNVSVVIAIIALAKSLGLEVTAEGVEMIKQLEFLQAQGCDRVQGFYFSEAVPGKVACELPPCFSLESVQCSVLKGKQ